MSKKEIDQFLDTTFAKQTDLRNNFHFKDLEETDPNVYFTRF
jgi:hypothetical protein